MCEQCIVGLEGCSGCIERCPHPEAWPEETVTWIGGDDGEIAKLEAWALPTEEGKMPGYVRIYDREGKRKIQQPVIISLPMIQ